MMKIIYIQSEEMFISIIFREQFLAHGMPLAFLPLIIRLFLMGASYLFQNLMAYINFHGQQAMSANGPQCRTTSFLACTVLRLTLIMCMFQMIIIIVY